MTSFIYESLFSRQIDPASIDPNFCPGDDELAAQIALSRLESVPLRLRTALLTNFGSAQKIFSTSETVLLKLGLSQTHVNAITHIKDFRSFINELEQLRCDGTEIVSLCDARYPSRLREIATPPLVLYGRGNLRLLESSCVLAVVGSRNMTEYGARVLERFIEPLVEAHVAIVSGLAIGVDAKAHEICLRLGGKALVVQAQGVDRGYPGQNHELYKKVISCGLVLSEFACPPRYMGREMFPRRNRIVSGLSDGVLVVEAKEKSGSLVTAHFALGQNREVFAVPGGIFQEMSRGCLSLIGSGAKLVVDASDILEEFQDFSVKTPLDRVPERFSEVVEKKSQIATDKFETLLEKKIFEFCLNFRRSTDEIIENSGESVALVTAMITKMQLVGTLIEEKNGVFLAIP